MVRKPKNLSPDDRALWKKVTDSTARLHKLRTSTTVVQSEPLGPSPKSPKVNAPQFRVGERTQAKPKTNDLAPSMSDHLSTQRISMDRKAFGKLKKGRMSPESRLDLHGMTVAQAHPVLLRFILESAAMDRRLVLVITGKGKHRDDGGPIPVRHGVLRHQVPHWLHAAPLRQHVLQISEAHLKHGGQGAYYVYLRRRK